MNRTPENIAAAHAELLRLLLEHDARLCQREMKAFKGTGLPNIYRSGHYIRSASGVRDLVLAGHPWMFSLFERFERANGGAGFDLLPVNAFVHWLAKTGWIYRDERP